MSWPIGIAGVGTSTAVGLTATETAASVRAGISRVVTTEIASLGGDPYRAAFLPEEYLDECDDPLPHTERDSDAERLIRLAAPALREACQPYDFERRPPTLVLAIDSETRLPQDSPALFLEDLSRQSAVRLDLEQSRVVRGGRAAGMAAIVEVCQQLLRPDAAPVLVGAVDSYCNQDRLGRLDLDGRILTDTNLDGFLPGEGAGMLLLARPGDPAVSAEPMALLIGAATGFEKGHFYAEPPFLGDGLAQTLQTLFASLPRDQLPCAAVLANLNGESFAAKQWGIALVRNRASFVEKPALFHPAECFGESGAAMGPILLAIATCWLKGEVHGRPFLVWCAADEGPCAACYVVPHAATPKGSHAPLR